MDTALDERGSEGRIIEMKAEMPIMLSIAEMKCRTAPAERSLKERDNHISKIHRAKGLLADVFPLTLNILFDKISELIELYNTIKEYWVSFGLCFISIIPYSRTICEHQNGTFGLLQQQICSLSF